MARDRTPLGMRDREIWEAGRRQITDILDHYRCVLEMYDEGVLYPYLQPSGDLVLKARGRVPVKDLVGERIGKD